jgi:hypothetical protein
MIGAASLPTSNGRLSDYPSFEPIASTCGQRPHGYHGESTPIGRDSSLVTIIYCTLWISNWNCTSAWDLLKKSLGNLFLCQRSDHNISEPSLETYIDWPFWRVISWWFNRWISDTAAKQRWAQHHFGIGSTSAVAKWAGDSHSHDVFF